MTKNEEKAKWEEFKNSFPDNSYSKEVVSDLISLVSRDIDDDFIWKNFRNLRDRQKEEQEKLLELEKQQKEIEQKLKSMMTILFWAEQSIQRMRDAIDPQKWMEKLGEARAEVEHCRQIIKSI